MMYRERASRISGAVAWQRTPTATGSVSRILPDGCMDLMWVDEQLVVAGPDTAAWLATIPPGTGYSALRFQPGTGPAVLGVPAHELRDQRVPLADVWPASQVRRLTARMHQAGNPIQTLEEIAAAGAAPDRMISHIVARLRAGVPVGVTANAVGLGERQLLRRCLAAFGYGPKTLERILRMNHAVDLARGGTPFAAVAASTGYADQAHLAREVKALAGVPLTVLTS
jgi:AraC-like DNA-binding protein